MATTRRAQAALVLLLAATAAFSVVEGAGGAKAPEAKGPSLAAPRPYRRFHADDSFIGRPLPCTSDEKVCFRYNLVLDKKSDRCQAIGDGYVGGCELRADRKEFESRSGRLYGVCREYEDPCPGYRMAFDGQCYSKEVVRNVICGCPVEPTAHFLGGVECRCVARSSPIRVEQPKEAGRCRMPDLRHPDRARPSFLKTPLRTAQFLNPNCSVEQKRCFARGKVWVAKKQGCFTLLERGACEADEVVVLTKDEWTRGSAVCVNRRGGCPLGRVRMAFDGQCHNEREMQIAAPGRIVLSVMGEYEVLGYDEGRKYSPNLHSNACAFGMSGVNGPPPGAVYPKPPCDDKDKSQCSMYKVHNIPPSPQ